MTLNFSRPTLILFRPFRCIVVIDAILVCPMRSCLFQENLCKLAPFLRKLSLVTLHHDLVFLNSEVVLGRFVMENRNSLPRLSLEICVDKLSPLSFIHGELIRNRRFSLRIGIRSLFITFPPSLSLLRLLLRLFEDQLVIIFAVELVTAPAKFGVRRSGRGNRNIWRSGLQPSRFCRLLSIIFFFLLFLFIQLLHM